ncbi:MAG: VPLPA-CTERM sorting domain-containing protein [Salaquimonas sp.]|nr:VPLPA-CTERM sorting domain-containing protein [Salaquimonas sp.]
MDGDNDNASEQNRIGRGDAIRFVFSPDVRFLTTLAFEVGTYNEKFALYDSNGDRVDSGDAAGESVNFVIPGGGASDTHVIDLSSFHLDGPFFTIVGVTCSPCGTPNGSNDQNNEDNRGFRLASISVGIVPVPAALPLFASGFGVLGIAGWRRKRKVASAAA